MFWMIYAVDRELVYPKILDKIIPSWLNHVMVSSLLFHCSSILCYIYWSCVHSVT